jgi:hypothetical protein
MDAPLWLWFAVLGAVIAMLLSTWSRIVTPT